MKYFNPKYLTIDKLSKNSHDMISFRLKEFVKRYNITEYPINCFKLLERIILSNTIKLEYKKSDQFSENLDAAAEYHGKEAGYCIMFNSRKIRSFDFSPHRRCNFTLAHELGHIFLGHLLIPSSLKSKADILYEEWEADEFAARLLMPEILLLNCNFITKVTAEFLVSSPDLFTRVNNLKRLDLYKSKPIPTCKTCGNTHFSLCTRYCKICGTEVNKTTTPKGLCALFILNLLMVVINVSDTAMRTIGMLDTVSFADSLPYLITFCPHGK